MRLHHCLIDGDAIVSDGNGLAVFDLIRRRRSGLQAVLCAFDLLELDDEEVQGALLPHPVHGVQSASC
jgi:ATP-dependent DNA ligase